MGNALAVAKYLNAFSRVIEDYKRQIEIEDSGIEFDAICTKEYNIKNGCNGGLEEFYNSRG